VYDEFNAPIRFGRSMEENKEIALANHETMGIRLFGTSAPEILQRIKQKHGTPPVNELTEFFYDFNNLSRYFGKYCEGDRLVLQRRV
jgi:hypothetical protein